MNQTRNIDFPLENKQCSELELFRPFQRSPESKPIEMCQQEKSELLDISASIRNDISYLQTEKKKIMPKTSFKLLGLLKVDKLIQNFKQTLAKKAYVYNKQSRKVIEKFTLEKYLSKKTTKFNVYNEEKYCQIPTFDQSNIVIQFWEFIKIFSLIFILWVIPFIWSFENKQQDKTFFVFCYSLTYILFDILIKLNTQIISQGNVIKERKQILNFYLKDELLGDALLFFSILMILITFHDQNDSEHAITSSTSLLICSVVSYIKLNDQINKMLLYTNMNHLHREYLNLISLLFSISSFAHILACVWHFVGDKSGVYFHKSWLIQKGLQDESVQTRYCFSYYWATVTMITVGYGDITPQNTIETLVCILLMFMACVVFAYSINKIGSILQSINDQKAQFILNIRIVSHYLRQHSIPTHLQNRIRSYLQYLQDESLNQNTQIVTQIQDKLPSMLKSELKYNVFKYLIKNCEFLLVYFSEKTLQNLSLKMKPFQYCPDEVIYLQGSNEDCSLYFIDYGGIKLIENQSQTELCTLKSGQQFGEWEFFTQQARKCTAMSVGFTKVYKIQREDFLNSLDFDDTEKFHQIKDKILQHLPIDGIKCTACGSKTHTILDCSYLFYKPDLERIILAYNYQKNIERKPWKRQLGRFETLKMLPIIQLQQIKFQQKQELNEKNSSAASIDQEQQKNSQEQIYNLDSISQVISIKQIPQEIHNSNPSQIKISNSKLNESKSAKGIYLIEPKNSNQQTDLVEYTNKQQGDKRHNTFIIKDAQNRTLTNADHQVLQTDRQCEFHHYFTHLNCSKIILSYNSFTKCQKKLSRRLRGNICKYTLMQSFTKQKLLGI